VGLSSTINFAYFLRLRGGVTTTTTTTTMAYIVDLSTTATVAQVDVTALMPTTVNNSYTEVTARFSSPFSLVAWRSYWLPFCFTTTATTASRVVTREENAITMAGASASGGKTTVGSCEGGPSCKPEIGSGSLATVISSSKAATSGDGDGGGGGGGGGGGTIAIAAGVAVPVALAVAGLLACVVAYIAYTRAKGRLGQRPPARRRSSARSLESEVRRVHENDMFELSTFSRPADEHHHKLNKESWLNA
jgi:hypothetical protein